MRKIYWIIPAIAGLALLVYFMSSSNAADDENKPISTPVISGKFAVSVQATGELRAKNSVKITGPSRMREAGIWQTTISRILPEGTVVKKGDWVASLDKSGITGKFDETRTEIEKIETQLEQEKIDTTMALGNMRDQLSDLKFDLKEKKLLVEQSQFEAQMIIQQAQLSLERIKRDFEQLQKNYRLTQRQKRARIAEINASLRQQKNKMAVYEQISSEFDVTAPEDGMLIYITQWNGEKIAQGGQVSAWDPQVGELPDLTSMISVTYVNEVDISKVKIGQEVEVGIDAFPDKIFDGKVTKVANVGQQLRNQDAKVFEIIVELNNSDSTLRPAMTTSNKINVRQYDEAVYIPLEALSQDSMPYVIVRRNNKIAKQEVLLGQVNENHVMIELGLDANDEVFLFYNKDRSLLDFNPLNEEDRKSAIFRIEQQNKEYDVLMNEKAKKTTLFNGQSAEAASTMIIFN
jgi:hypothetical protein